jgi:hypothetical protein
MPLNGGSLLNHLSRPLATDLDDSNRLRQRRWADQIVSHKNDHGIRAIYNSAKVGTKKRRAMRGLHTARRRNKLKRFSWTGQVPAVHLDREHRDLRLDACRGLALWFIFIDHIPGNSFAWLTLRNYGFSDATEVFVFVSGYTCMLAYGGALREQGWQTIMTRCLRRGVEIYAAFLLLVIAYLVLIRGACSGSFCLDETNTRFFFENPGTALMHVTALQYTPVNTDILPMFVMLHLAFPLVLWLLIRNAAVALGASFLLYLMVQIFGWNLPAWPTDELYFNPLAWQFLFVFGAWYAGWGAGRLKGIMRSRATLLLAVFYIAFGLIVTLSWQIEPLKWLIPDVISLIYPIYKSRLDPVRLLHFLALAVLVSRFIPRDWHGMMKPWMVAMIRCGENSLPIYCFSVLLSFLAFVILKQVYGSLAMQAAVSAVGIALIIAAATFLTWEAKLDRRGPKLF